MKWQYPHPHFWFPILFFFLPYLWLWFLIYSFEFFLFMVLVFSFIFFFPFRLLFQTSLSWWLKKPSWRLNTGKVSSPNNISAVHCVFIMMVPWIAMIRKHNQSGPQLGKHGHDRPLFFFFSVVTAVCVSDAFSMEEFWFQYLEKLMQFLPLCAYTGTWCRMLHTLTRSKRSPARVKANPRRLWCTNWGPPTAATGAYRGEMIRQCTHAVILRNKRLNPPTPTFLHNSSKGEECDDMNIVNGDGCSNQCKKEPFFNCIGEFLGVSFTFRGPLLPLLSIFRPHHCGF